MAISLTVLDLYTSLYAFHLGQIISTVLGQVDDHGSQHGHAAQIQDKNLKTVEIICPK